MRLPTVVLLASFFFLLSVPAQAGGTDWTGTWDSQTGSGNQYIFEFTQTGGTATGSYRGAGWEDSQASVPIENGTVSGNVLHFTENDLYEYEFTRDGDSFTGKWGYLSSPGSYTGGTYTGERRVEEAKLGSLVIRMSPCTGGKDVTEFTVSRKRGKCRSWYLHAFMKNEDDATRAAFKKNGYKIYLEDVMPGGSFDNTQFGPAPCRYGSYPLRREGGKTCLVNNPQGGATIAGVNLGVAHDLKYKGTVRYRATLRKSDGTILKRSNVAKAVIKGAWKKKKKKN